MSEKKNRKKERWMILKKSFQEPLTRHVLVFRFVQRSTLSRLFLLFSNTGLGTSHSRPLSKDSASHKLWEVDPPILQLKSRSWEWSTGWGKCARSLALAHDVERLICQLESAAGGNDWRILLLAGAWPCEPRMTTSTAFCPAGTLVVHPNTARLTALLQQW